jgi:hypothetical protein
LEETNTELQVKEREMKKLKIQQLMLETTNLANNNNSAPGNTNPKQGGGSSFVHSSTQQQYLKTAQNRLSQGKGGNLFLKLNTQEYANNTGGRDSMGNSNNNSRR